MKHIGKKILSKFLSAPIFSPGGFLSYAVIFTVTFFMLEVLGLRSYTTVLFGMDSIAAGNGSLAICMAGIYLFFYFAFIVLAPVFFLGSMLFLLFNQLSSIFRKLE